MKKVALYYSQVLLLGACGNNDDSVDNVKKSTHKKTTLRFTKIKANQIVQMVKINDN